MFLKVLYKNFFENSKKFEVFSKFKEKTASKFENNEVITIMIMKNSGKLINLKI